MKSEAVRDRHKILVCRAAREIPAEKPGECISRGYNAKNSVINLYWFVFSDR